ncbi:hypothetical protein EDB81DRAFT_785775 [Dactylonectria macrodidyma]|uniref:F-box domain-containing protein n=1 Tax=Dactylonectria macrodidyma TaxID=307937 RepID=A0A9P9J836_9HYPO|nr:hypothetical protein EDB81DRAFT_785775 [Dactylonectria macrodidyma]
MSAFSLDAITNELLVLIADYLDHDALARLNRTCKRINAVIEPQIWTKIEFHSNGYHESSAEAKDPPPFTAATLRNYQTERHPGQYALGHIHENKAMTFVNLLQDYHANNQERLKELCSRVKHLCTGVIHEWGQREGYGDDEGDNKTKFWQIIPYFTNLETLEIHGDNTALPLIIDEITAPPLQKLRFTKLFAYVPLQFAQWVMKSAPTLERLDLGLLDRPISTSLANNPENPPLPEENLGDSDGESDYGSLCGENVIPRPMGGIVCGRLEPNLSRLKTLYLCSPAASPVSEDAWSQYTFSSRAERACFSDWRRLLLASSRTLETLVLDQRPGAEYIENDGVTEAEYMRLNEDGNINKALVKLVKDLLVDKDTFPLLKHVYLYGFAVAENSERQPGEKTPGGRLMLDLAQRGVKCEARLGKWCFFDSDPGYTFWCKWEDDDDDEEDEEDSWDTLLAQV